MDFVPLRVHSWYSFLAAASSPAALCRRAREAGWGALALTDIGGLWGAPEFAAAAAREGVRPLLGAELPTREGRLVLLARGEEGYRSLCRLIGAFHLDPEFDPVRTTARLARGLLVLAQAPRLLARLALRLPPQVLFAGLPPPGAAGADLPGPGREDVMPRGRRLPDPPAPPSPAAVRLAARRLGLRLVALPDVYRAGPEEAARHRVQLAVKNGTLIDRVLECGGQDMPGPVEIARWYGGDEEAVARTVELARRCSCPLPRGRPPIFPPLSRPGKESAGERLERLAREGLERLYDKGDRAAAERLREELAAITAAGFAPYFLLLREIVDFARGAGIPCMGRGSAAASLTARCLGLTEPDPLRHGLVFERFLNPGRSDLPDVDLDFCWKRREQVIAYTRRRWGEAHAATLGTLVRLGSRGALREAALAVGVPPRTAGLCAEQAHLLRERRGAGELARVVGSAAAARRVIRAAELLHEVPHHMGLHPGGTVILPFPLADLLPLQRSAEGLTAVQFDKHSIEETGAVKLDLLGNRGLTLVDYAIDCIRSQDREPPDLDRVAEDDRATGRLVREGRTLGCFQIESPAMRQLLKGLGADRLETVVQALALVRPGPAAGGMKESFLRRRRGLEPVPRLHPRFDRVLADTAGVMLYQEDVLRVTEAVTGLGLAAADRLRGELKRSRGDEEGRHRLAECFLLAAGRRGVPPAAARAAWSQVERFTGYSFCKAHAVSYGRLAWKCAWLKAHEPAAFMAALLSSGAGMYAKTVYVSEARRLGLRVLPPHVNRSGERWGLEAGGRLRASLAEVRGVSGEKAARIAAGRRGGPYRGAEDLRRRVPDLARDELENLVLAGALDGLGADRALLVLQARLGGGKEEVDLFGAATAGPVLPLAGPAAAERERQALWVLGFSPGRHPLRLRDAAPPPGTVGCGRALARRGRVRLEGWVIAARRVSLEKGRWVLFFTLEDESGFVEVVSRPGGGRPERVPAGEVLYVEGRVVEHLGAPAVQAERVRVTGMNPLERGWKAR